ncbi:MAG: glycosyltransferase family 2 protein [Anaerolineaceae bacterium]|nr:MAG: glycosyltransferase family 2 protein [Anaerolineaceae bacterium]
MGGKLVSARDDTSDETLSLDIEAEAETESEDSATYLKLSIVIPVYNEQATIQEVVKRVMDVELPLEKEIIVADDGSTDGSSELIERQRAANADIIETYTSPMNQGKGAAIRKGFKLATGEIVLVQDADLELDPAEYVELIQPILKGQADVVYGSRFMRNNQNIPLKTRLANRFLTSLTNLLYRGNLTDMETGYKVIKRTVLDSLELRCVGFDIEPEVTARILLGGWNIHEIPVVYNPRTEDEGKKISWRDGIAAIYTLMKIKFS